jgi:hypothetical protein
MLSRKGEAAVTVAEVFTVAAGFMAEGFMAEGFMAEGFMAEAGSEVFTGAILGVFTAVGSRGFMAIAISSATVGFSFPVSMDTRDGGVGVIRIRTGVTHTTRITPTILTIPITRIRR